MAAGVGIGLSAVQRIWRAHRLQLHCICTFKQHSKDPEFGTKLRDVVGPYMEVARRRMGPSAIEGYLEAGNLHAAAKILRQHFYHLDRSYRYHARIPLRLSAATIAPVRAHS
jgi:hypothetical protein